MKDATKMLRKLTDVSERYQSDGQSLASGHLWPYRCYNAETTKVLDVYLSDVLLQIVALVRNRDERLAMFLHGVFMNIPQFQGYVGEMVKASLTSMCSLIEESQSRELTVQSILKVLEKLSTETQVPCTAQQSRFLSTFKDRYSIAAVSHGLQKRWFFSDIEKVRFFLVL